MAELSLARLMLRSAGHDIATCRVLASRRDIPDTILGFHAQQACEKCVKALLSAGNIETPRTHDLVRLIDLRRLEQS